METFISTFLKIFFLMTPFFVLTMFLTMTQDATVKQRKALALKVTLSVSIISLILLFFWKAYFYNFLFQNACFFSTGIKIASLYTCGICLAQRE